MERELHGGEAQALFNRELATYRKFTAHNLMFHREVYGLLRDMLVNEVPPQFAFLDLGCGDASASVAMLAGLPIGRYHGVDLSDRSLEIAAQNLAALSCDVALQRSDFGAALSTWNAPVDVVWIGQSLHHYQSAEKRRTMKAARAALRQHGIFMIWEPVLRPGEDRLGWVERLAAMRPDWQVLSDQEFANMKQHSILADYPETRDDWIAMGRAAGFSDGAQVFMAPNNLAGVFKFVK